MELGLHQQLGLFGVRGQRSGVRDGQGGQWGAFGGDGVNGIGGQWGSGGEVMDRTRPGSTAGALRGQGAKVRGQGVIGGHLGAMGLGVHGG